MKKTVSLYLALFLTLSWITTEASTINITTKASGVTISAPDSCEAGADISFSYTLDKDADSVHHAFAKINGASAINKNSLEGVSANSTFFGQNTETSTSFKCEIVEDTDSPMAGILPYKHVITKQKAPNSNTWRSYSISNIISSKPSTISIGFWLKDSSVQKVFSNVPFAFWLFYNTSYTAIPEIPVSTLINNVGVYQSGTFHSSSSNISNAMTSYAAKTACLHRDNGWSYFVYDLENIVYAGTFNPSATYFYEWFNNAYNNLVSAGNPAIEMSNFTFLTGEKIKSGYIIYSGAGDTSHKYVLSKTEASLTIPGEVVTADVEIEIIANDSVPPEITGVADGQVYTASVTPLCDDEYAVITLERNGALKSYTIGTPIAEPGIYRLTAKDYSKNVSSVVFKIKDKASVSVGKNAVGCTITGNNEASQYESYSFTVNVSQGAEGISLGYVEYEDGGRKTYTLTPGKTEFTLPDYIITGDFEIYVWASECIGDTTVESVTPVYDKNVAANLQSISVKLNPNGNNILNVLLDNNEVSYEYSDGKYKFTNIVLNDLTIGVHNIKFVTDFGEHPTVSFTVTDSSDASLPVRCSVKGDQIVVCAKYNETHNITHRFSGLTEVNLDKNVPINFGYSYLIPKTESNIWATGTTLASGGDECAPFNYNSSYIGANHGQSNAVLVTMASHGKTYSDIGSYWKDSSNRYWNLLKIVDENSLLFLSDNQSASKTKYTFSGSISGKLTYVSHGEHTGDIIVQSQAGSQQLYSSIRHREKSVYAVIGDNRYLLSGNATAICDYIDVVEKYDIMNPSLIGQYLRQNRPEGGYTEPQSMAIGEALVSYDVVYRILPDGTVLTIMNHEILGDVNFDYYGGIQYQQRNNAFGGNVWRYLPETKPFTAVQANTGTQYYFDFTKPFNTTVNNVPRGITLTSGYWENAGVVPDRQVDYMRDTSGKNIALFAGGFLPIQDGEPAERLKKTTASTFIYQTKKTYPYFVSGSSIGKNGTKIQGVAYKKFEYQGNDNSIGSSYTIPYGNTTYIYLDYHETGSDKYIIPENLRGSRIGLVKKSSNVTYEIKGSEININVTERAEGYGYLVLAAVSEGLSVTGSEITAAVAGEAFLTIAGYDENGLIDVKSFNISETTVKSIDSIGISENATKIKVFLWRNGVKPVSKSIALR